MRTEDLPRLIDEASVLGFVDSQLLGISHQVRTDPAARWVYADRIQVQQVLINLIRNSVQAMMGEPRREIRISTSLSSGDMRSEEHTSELQSLMRISYAVFCLK